MSGATTSIWNPIQSPGVQVTCAQINALNASNSAIPGQAYIVTDYNRGTVGAARILVHGVSSGAVGHTADIATSFDNSAWSGRFDPDTCRIYDMRDNRENHIRGAVGAEVEAFPWGNGSVIGNDFHGVNLQYISGTMRGNVANMADGGFIQMNGGDMRNCRLGVNADVRLSNGYRLYNANFIGRARFYATSAQDTGYSIYCVFGGDSYIEPGAVNFERCQIEGGDVRIRGSVGRVDRLTMQSYGQFYARNIPSLDIDRLNVKEYGRVLFDNAARLRVLDSSIANYGYIQRAGGTPTLTLNYANIDTYGYIRMYQGTLQVDRSRVHSNARIDCNTPGSNFVDRAQIGGSNYVRFWDTVTNCRVDYAAVSNYGYIDFRGDSNGARFHRGSVSDGNIYFRNSNSFVRHSSVRGSRSYIRIHESDCPVEDVHMSAWGRMDIFSGRTGRVWGVSATGTAYIRLTGGTGTLQHSHFSAYYYHYCTNQTGTHQGLHGHGRQTYTAPAGALTGAGERNY